MNNETSEQLNKEIDVEKYLLKSYRFIVKCDLFDSFRVTDVSMPKMNKEGHFKNELKINVLGIFDDKHKLNGYSSIIINLLDAAGKVLKELKFDYAQLTSYQVSFLDYTSKSNITTQLTFLV